ncbi:unnamed protein product [Amoebophrya sp. A25]|nr:unnamed protein product [Amoebophrya sp. A25]|eukprot:GSA25T00009065001.1
MQNIGFYFSVSAEADSYFLLPSRDRDPRVQITAVSLLFISSVMRVTSKVSSATTMTANIVTCQERRTTPALRPLIDNNLLGTSLFAIYHDHDGGHLLCLLHDKATFTRASFMMSKSPNEKR